jgi:hypothetical protein
MPSTTVLRGNILQYFLIQPTLTPVAVAANTTAAQTFTVPGLLTTDFLTVSFNGAQTTGIIIANDYVSAANTLTIQFGNLTASSATPASGQYLIEVIRADGPIPATAG